MIPDEPLGKIIKRERNNRGWTLRDMAQRVKSNFAYLSQIEAGLAKPSEELVERITDAFDYEGEDRERFMFIARGVSAQIKEIKDKYPTVAPQYFRKAARKEDE